LAESIAQALRKEKGAEGKEEGDGRPRGNKDAGVGNATRNAAKRRTFVSGLAPYTQFCLRTTVFKEPKLSFSNNHQFRKEN
jgi:hypothetical protein